MSAIQGRRWNRPTIYISSLWIQKSLSGWPRHLGTDRTSAMARDEPAAIEQLCTIYTCGCICMRVKRERIHAVLKTIVYIYVSTQGRVRNGEKSFASEALHFSDVPLMPINSHARGFSRESRVIRVYVCNSRSHPQSKVNRVLMLAYITSTHWICPIAVVRLWAAFLIVRLDASLFSMISAAICFDSLIVFFLVKIKFFKPLMTIIFGFLRLTFP